MANPFFSGNRSSGRGNPFFSGNDDEPRKRGGLLGLAGNFAGDIKDAVVGLPTGLVMSVKHPLRAGEQLAEMEWQTWSPLFKGDLEEFGQGLYDHPLAPLLDVMTVFTMGAGAAARGASVLEAAGAEGRVVTGLSGLRKARSRTLTDPTELGRRDVKAALSTKAGRRAVQELKIRYLEPHLPKWWSNSKYENAYRKDLAHRRAATNQIEADALKATTAQVAAFFKGGEVLSDPKAWGEGRQAIAATIWQGLERHAPQSVRKGRPITVERATGPARSAGYIKGRERYTQPMETVEAIDPAAPPKLREHEAFLLKPELLKERVGKLDKPEDFETFIRNFGREGTTQEFGQAFRRDDGTYPVVDTRGAARSLGMEAARSSFAMRWLWEKPTRAWKTLMVGYAPRTIVNNGVGNWLLYAMRQGGDASFAGLYDAIRITKGERYARKMAAPQLYGAQSQSWAYKWHMDELGNTYAHAMGLDGASSKTRRGKLASQGLYPIVHATSDKPVRLATLASFYRKAPEVQALMKKGYKFDDAVEAAIVGNPDLRLAATERVRSVAGDYVTMRPWENAIRNVVPFYLWDRHIVKTALNMTADQPGRIVALQKVSNMGIEETEKILGEMPEFLRGALPLELLGLSGAGGDRVSVLLTSGLNPYATLAELAAAGEAATIGSGKRNLNSALFGVNPFITGAVEAATGRSLLTGAPVSTRGGIIPSVIDKTLRELPYPKVGRALLTEPSETSPSGNPYLYRHDVASPLSSLLGVPIRSVSRSASQRVAKQPRF